MNRTWILSMALGLLVLACSSGTAAEGSEMAANGKPNGAKIYSMHCSLCHGKDGRLGISGAKDLTLSTLTREEMLALVNNGRGTMAPYKNVLSKAEIEAVVAHVRTLHVKE